MKGGDGVTTIVDDLQQCGISIHEQVNAIFSGTQSLLEASIPIRNVISSLEKNHTDFDTAIAATYTRMSLTMESLTRLNHPGDFQVALHCARCLYESHIDAVQLLRTPELLPKFMAFTFVAKFAAAEKLIEELRNQGISDPSINSIERNFISDAGRRKKFDDERKNYWPKKNGDPKTPMNWNGNLPDRATAIGPNEELRYRRVYSQLCWYSHAGVVGVADMSADALEAAMGMAHGYAQTFFFDTTNLIAEHFGIYRANPQLKVPVDRYKLAVMQVLHTELSKPH